MLRTYPEVDDDFVRLWRDSMDRYGLTPSAVGTNLDMGRRKDRDPDEEGRTGAAPRGLLGRTRSATV